MLAAGRAEAQSPAADSLARDASAAPALATPADSLGGGAPGLVELPVAVTADSIARGRPAGPTPWPDQPRFVMLRSLLIPGWGQAYNRAWIKAAGVAGTEIWLGRLIVQDKDALEVLLADVEEAQAGADQAEYTAAVNRYNARLDTYVRHQWFLGGVLAYALIDAYVDAHFRNFDIEFRHDPALPADEPADPDAPSGGGPARRGGTRLALRWHF